MTECCGYVHFESGYVAVVAVRCGYVQVGRGLGDD